jgi:hypothetical protein
MKRVALTAVILTASLALFARQSGQGAAEKIDELSDWIVVGKTAYGFLPPLRVSDANIVGGEWSRDGNFYLGLSRTESRREFVRYAVGTARATPVSLPMKGRMRGFNAVFGSFFAFDIAGTTYLYEANQQSWRLLEGTEDLFLTEIQVRVKGDRVLLKFSQQMGGENPVRPKMVLFEVGINGALIGPITAPAARIGYGVDGSLLTYTRVRNDISNISRWNGTQWVPAPTAKIDFSEPAPLPGEFVSPELRDVKMFSGSKAKAGVLRNLEGRGADRPGAEASDRWNTLPTEVVIGAPLKSQPDPSPTLNAVAYIQAGVLFMRPTIRIPADEFRKALLERWKSEALMNVKQVGTALMIYTADYDDMLPDGNDLVNKVMPYVKSADILSSFVYTFPGGDSGKIKDPAATELGYIPGPGGRAVVYADGHAKWIPDK